MFYHFIQNMSAFYHNRQTPLHEAKANDKNETTPSIDKNRKLNDTTSSDKPRPANDMSFSTFKRSPSSEQNRHTTNTTATSTDINDVSRQISNNIDVLELIDSPLPDFYDLFNERVKSKYYKNDSDKSMDKNNVKTAMNKRVRHLKNKLRELIA